MSDDGREDVRPLTPLVVDLDGTVLRSDTLIEGLTAGLFQKPFSTLAQSAGAAVSVPRFKAWVFDNINVDYEAIPANGPLVDWLREEKARGRQIHLVSAANQGVVDRLADRFDVFDSAHGSSSTHNLKGRNKRRFILERFGPDAVYAGDARPDFHVWQGVGGAVYAGTSTTAVEKLRREGRLEADFSRAAPSLRDWIRALRLHQWSKNLLLFVPLILAHAYTDVAALTSTVMAFFLLGIIASGTYLINDMSDLASDRGHRSKKSRPLPAGVIPLAQALVVAPLLIVIGLIASWMLKPAFAIVEVAYIVVTLSYSLYFKKVALLDVFVLAGLYTLRLVMGAVATGVAHSLWLLTFSMFFFLSLSLAKRHVEITAARIAPAERVAGRGYYPEDWPLTLALGVSAAAGSVLILVLYLVDSAWAPGLYKSPGYLGGLPVVIAFWTARIWLFAHRGELHDDPIVFALKDRMSWALGGAMLGLLATAVLL